MNTTQIIEANLILDPIETSPEHARGDHLVEPAFNEHGEHWCNACGERLLDPETRS